MTSAFVIASDGYMTRSRWLRRTWRSPIVTSSASSFGFMRPPGHAPARDVVVTAPGGVRAVTGPSCPESPDSSRDRRGAREEVVVGGGAAGLDVPAASSTRESALGSLRRVAFLLER